MHTETLNLTGYSPLRVRLHYPEAWNITDARPLVIGLHGGGGNFENFSAIWEGVEDRQFIYGALEAPYTFSSGSGTAYEWARWPSGARETIITATSQTLAYVTGAAKELAQKFGTKKIYLLGFSQGAIMAYSTGIMYPQVFSGLICLSGPGLLETMHPPWGAALEWEWVDRAQLPAANTLPVFIAHGRNDQMARYELGELSKNLLLSHGYDVTFRAFNGAHSVPPKGILQEIAAWIDT